MQPQALGPDMIELPNLRALWPLTATSSLKFSDAADHRPAAGDFVAPQHED
ncbi:hypothetical protein [Rhizobium terrae]|uniref:hypothetical protein n=1 Tax=Rhizobium terrae TaxID=2171756 RepID=UPI0013C33A41|nr:hypothetical protein [Rhizobium terrae]